METPNPTIRSDPFDQLDLAVSDACQMIEDMGDLVKVETADALRDSWKDAKAHHERLESLARRALEAFLFEQRTGCTLKGAAWVRFHDDLRDELSKKETNEQ